MHSRALTRKNRASIATPEVGPPAPAMASARPRSNRVANDPGTPPHPYHVADHLALLLVLSTVAGRSPVLEIFFCTVGIRCIRRLLLAHSVLACFTSNKQRR